MGRVKKVDLYENGTIAIVEAVSLPSSILHAYRCAHHRVVQLGSWRACSRPFCWFLSPHPFILQVSPELGNRVQRVRVQLPGTSQELLQKFRNKNVDFAAHSNTEDSNAVLFNLLGACCTALASCQAPRCSEIASPSYL